MNKQELQNLVATINEEHAAGEEASRRGLDHYRRAGAALLRAKEQVGHGNWKTWCEKYVKFPQQRASEYMRLAKYWGKIPPGGTLGLKAALRFIADELGKYATSKTKPIDTKQGPQSRQQPKSPLPPTLPDDGTEPPPDQSGDPQAEQPSADTRGVLLRFSKDDAIEFEQLYGLLRPILGTANPSETVLVALRRYCEVARA